MNQYTNDGTGTGTFVSNITGLSLGTVYYVRAYATNMAGTTYGPQVAFATLGCPLTIQDIDGNSYHTVQIGNQCWMKENLKTTRYRDGLAIPNLTSSGSWAGALSGAWCTYNNDTANNSVYGKLYNSFATATANGLCPIGNHIPNDAEWTVLTDYLGGLSVAGAKLKETGLAHWLSPNTGATNETGFTGLAGGYRNNSGTFVDFGKYAMFWAAYTSGSSAWKRCLYYDRANVDRSSNYQQYGFFVRCIRDDIPTVTTNSVSVVGATSATVGGVVVNDAASTVTARGVCYSTYQNPTISDPHLSIGTGTGSFSSSITGLTISTTYYVRAYAINGFGVAYGNQVNFNTLGPPTITTSQVTSIGANTAISGGNITYSGGASVTSKGVCWSASPNPTIANFFTNEGTGTGTFSSNLSSLLQGTTYYVRAYATNSIGTTYGEQVSFTTISPPVLSTNLITNIGISTATGGGNITNDGGSPVTARGVCWSSSQNPTLYNYYSDNGTGTGQFLSNISGLTQATSYYVRSYATNAAGTAYGNQVNFTTYNLSSLTTNEINNIGLYSASGGGNITDDGGSPVTARGLCWSTSQNPTVSDAYTVDGSGTGTFTSNLTGLSVETTYFVRAYATNNTDTAYGNQVSFSTISTPSIITNDITSIGANTAIGGGSVTSDGGAAITERGVCWSTSPNPTMIDSHTSDSLGIGTFASRISDLLPGTTYYVKAYAINAAEQNWAIRSCLRLQTALLQ